jgi:hypothetical protein
MTDDAEIEVILARLAATQAKSHRVFRRTTLTSAGALLLLAAINAAFVLLGGGAWVMRDLVMVGGLTCLGMLGHLGAVTAYQVVVQRDAELLDGLRKQAEMATALDEVRPLMAAIEEARIKGVPLLIPPGSVAPAAGPPTTTVH